MTGKNGLSFKEVVKKYPQVSKFVILKMDLQRRGVKYTSSALDQAQDEIYQHREPGFLYGRANEITSRYPEGLLLRDGTSVCLFESENSLQDSNPYTVDLCEGKFTIFDRDELIDQCELWLRPAYYGKKTSRGKPMEHIVSARPQRLNLCSPSFCLFFDQDNNECKFCSFVPDLKDQSKAKVGRVARLHPDDVYETIAEALKEEGRWTSICISGGSDYRGNPPFEIEVIHYLEILKAIGKNFGAGRFPSQLIASNFTKEQLQRLYQETGLVSYTADLEVWDERIFKWVCPGKAKWLGREKWIESLIDAVEVFGKGNVDTNIVAGVELAEPYGFKSEEEALASDLEGAEFLAQHGVAMTFTVWAPRQETPLYNQKQPSLEFYVRLAQGVYDIWKQYGLTMDCDDYRHCGNHAVTDLLRLN